MGRVEIRRSVEFFRGGLPLARAFWLWGTLVTAGAPAWIAVLVFAAHIPWNLVLLVGVWRSAGRPEVTPAAAICARLVILVWVVVLSVL